MTTDDPARLITEADRQRALTVLRRAAEDGRLTPTARLTSQAFHQILAGEVPHTGRPTFDALFGDDPPKLELIPALAVLLDRWRRDRGR